MTTTEPLTIDPDVKQYLHDIKVAACNVANAFETPNIGMSRAIQALAQMALAVLERHLIILLDPSREPSFDPSVQGTAMGTIDTTGWTHGEIADRLKIEACEALDRLCDDGDEAAAIQHTLLVQFLLAELRDAGF